MDIAHPSPLALRPSPLDVLEGLARLVDQSLVVVEAAPVAGEEVVRYRLLEPVRQYAAAQLAREPRTEGTRQGEGGLVRERHAAYYLALAERAGPELHRADQPAWLERLEQEVDNLRAALLWADEQGGQAGAEAGLRFGYALWPFWWLRGYLSEGRGWLEDFLRAEGAQARTLLRARALFAAGRMALLGGDYPAARAWLEESLAITRELGHDAATAGALTQLGHVALQEGDYARARARYQGGLAIRQARGDKRDLAISYTSLGHVALAAGDHAGARRWLEGALAFYQEARDEAELARAQWLLGDVALAEGDVAEARGHYGESLARCRRLGHRQGIAYSLEGFALLAAAGARAAGPGSPGHRSGLERAVRLLGAVAALAEQVAVPPLPARRERLQRLHEEARGGLGEEEYAAAWQAGRAQSLEEATAEALHAADEVPPTAPAAGAIPVDLTPREVDVLRLIAAGRSNQEIARSLALSVRTVERHIGNLYGKLGARGRADAVTVALRHGLDPAEGTGTH